MGDGESYRNRDAYESKKRKLAEDWLHSKVVPDPLCGYDGIAMVERVHLRCIPYLVVKVAP